MRIAHPARLAGGPGRALRLAAGSGLALGLFGCAQLDQAIQPPPVNPSSPIAPYAEQVSHETFPTPDFSQVPPKPAHVRTASAYKAAVMGEVGLRRELAQWRASHPDLPSDVDAWADLQRHKIPHNATTPVSATQDAESEAFARRLREEAGKAQPK